MTSVILDNLNMIGRVNPQYIYIFSLVGNFHILDHHSGRLYTYIPGLIVNKHKAPVTKEKAKIKLPPTLKAKFLLQSIHGVTSKKEGNVLAPYASPFLNHKRKEIWCRCRKDSRCQPGPN